MPTLFRKIRKVLLSQNRLTKYLLYAIGEIVLVVIGILLALQINTWNQEKNNKKEEQFYLRKLQTNLVQDTVHLSTRTRQLSYTLDSLNSLEAQLRDENLKEFKNENMFYGLITLFRIQPQTSTFDNLISTGKLELISNQSIVDSLFNYYNDINNYTNQQLAADETYTRESIGPKLLEIEGGMFNGLKSSLSKKDVIFVLNAIELRKLLINGIYQSYLTTLNRNRNIYEMIEFELTSGFD
ncbi:DUF6090 family protein [Allomuricauda sp. NBRC 101325]|uniref:DUF6090 family protein n=1 Tax=Allomuricauda sp. NBRC 101325 TaxID=1113758 RepID=UPI0024A2B32B|nr:DUF6090 family protein [Muricauda sp. NBRC 101325]GLU43020.1 hypothetical protein Musp01_06440 [Muricauda sp. NBRC 101325]